MRVFAILLLCLNLLLLAWNLGFPGGRDSAETMVRAPVRQAPQTLQLVSEVPVPAETAGETGSDPACSEVSVFATRAAGEAFALAMAGQGYTSRVIPIGDGEPTFRVYMPPFNSETARGETMEALQQQGFESFVIDDGDLAGGISLGVFSSEDSALSFQERLAALGFAAAVRPIPAGEGVRVFIEGSVEQVGQEDSWQELRQEDSGLNLAEKLCETIAPAA